MPVCRYVSPVRTLKRPAGASRVSLGQSMDCETYGSLSVSQSCI